MPIKLYDKPVDYDLFIDSDNETDFYVRDMHDGEQSVSTLLEPAELNAATGTASLYTSAAVTSSALAFGTSNRVSGTSALTITNIEDGTVGHFRVNVPNTVTLAENSLYYLKGSLTATDSSEGESVKLSFVRKGRAYYFGT